LTIAVEPFVGAWTVKELSDVFSMAGYLAEVAVAKQAMRQLSEICPKRQSRIVTLHLIKMQNDYALTAKLWQVPHSRN
jgi:hypothetical protein